MTVYEALVKFKAISNDAESEVSYWKARPDAVIPDGYRISAWRTPRKNDITAYCYEGVFTFSPAIFDFFLKDFIFEKHVHNDDYGLEVDIN